MEREPKEQAVVVRVVADDSLPPPADLKPRVKAHRVVRPISVTMRGVAAPLDPALEAMIERLIRRREE